MSEIYDDCHYGTLILRLTPFNCILSLVVLEQVKQAESVPHPERIEPDCLLPVPFLYIVDNRLLDNSASTTPRNDQQMAPVGVFRRRGKHLQ